MCEEKEAGHSHLLVQHLYHIKIPYYTDPTEMQFEPGSEAVDALEVFADLAEYKEDEVKRIIAGAAALLEKYPHRSSTAAIYTAMVWERG